MPFNILVESNCNKQCSYCFGREITETSKQQRISVDAFQHLVDSLAKDGITSVGVTGGEPSIHPEILKIVDITLSAGLKAVIKTNGLWDKDFAKELTRRHPDCLAYLISILPPDDYHQAEWATLLSTLELIPQASLTLGITLSRPDFFYDHLLEAVRVSGAKRVRWSLAHPIAGELATTTFVPIPEYQKYSERIVRMVEDLSKYGVECIGDHCSILCMWTDDQLGRIVRAGGSIVTTCEPTVDFLPDKKAVFCLPMSSVANVSLEDIGGPGRAVAYFDRLADILKRHKLPFEGCNNCDHFQMNRCHGGCLAHRQWNTDIISAALKPWSVKKDGSMVLRFRDEVMIKKFQSVDGIGEEILVCDKQNNTTFRAAEDLFMLARLFDGHATLIECLRKMAHAMEEIEEKELEQEIDRFLFTAWMYNLLEEVH